MLVKPNPLAQQEGVAGFELALDFNGLPFELIPRAASEVKSKSKFLLLSVNALEQEEHPCRKLVSSVAESKLQSAVQNKDRLVRTLVLMQGETAVASSVVDR